MILQIFYIIFIHKFNFYTAKILIKSELRIISFKKCVYFKVIYVFCTATFCFVLFTSLKAGKF